MCVWHAEFRKQAASAGWRYSLNSSPFSPAEHHYSKPFPFLLSPSWLVPMPCLTTHLTVFLGQLHLWDHLRASVVSHSPCLLSTLCTLPILQDFLPCPLPYSRLRRHSSLLYLEERGFPFCPLFLLASASLLSSPSLKAKCLQRMNLSKPL